MNLKSFLLSVMAMWLVVSCGAPKEVSYFQDAEQYGVMVPVKENHIRLRPEDKISIVVNTSNDALTSLFQPSVYLSAHQWFLIFFHGLRLYRRRERRYRFPRVG